MLVDINKLMEVPGIGLKIFNRIKRHFDKDEYISKYNKNIHLETNKIHKGDCLTLMNGIPDKSVDLILTDLPYEETQNSWDSIIPLDRLWKQYNRILKDDGAIVLTAHGVFTAKLIISQLNLYKYRWIWKKSKATNFLNAKKQPLRKHEDICVFYKNPPTYNPQMTEGEPYNKGYRKYQQTGSYGHFNSSLGVSDGDRYPVDILYFKTAETEGEVIHPNQKPIALLEYFIKTYTNEGDLVLDNSSGSGGTAIASRKNNRQFLCIEKNDKHHKDSLKRFKDFFKK